MIWLDKNVNCFVFEFLIIIRNKRDLCMSTLVLVKLSDIYLTPTIHLSRGS